MGKIVAKWCFVPLEGSRARPICVDARLDSGADHTVLPEKLAKRIGLVLPGKKPPLRGRRRAKGRYYIIGGLRSAKLGCSIPTTVVFGSREDSQVLIGVADMQEGGLRMQLHPARAGVDAATCTRRGLAPKSVGAAADPVAAALRRFLANYKKNGPGRI